MRFALTCNGPGEFAGWVRPLVRAFSEIAPEIELHCFFVPDDYATGREADLARQTLPGLKIHSPKEYIQFALGAKTDLHDFNGVLYLGGDILHAARIHSRLGGAFFAYRYAPKHIAKRVQYAFALDEKNAKTLKKYIQADRIEIIGNLAVDGAIAEANGVFGKAKKIIPEGVLFMPGSRRHEIAYLMPFFATTAMYLRRLLPDLPISFGLSPFTDLHAVDQALRPPLDSHMYAKPARVVEEAGEPYIVSDGVSTKFPIVHEALQTAVKSKLVVTIPGTKCIELAALGVPHLVCTPFNLPERAVINGPLTYLDRLPLFGAPLKRMAVVKFAERFKYFAQPNIDADEELAPELKGTLTPGFVAEKAAELAENLAWQQAVNPKLKALYASHVGVTQRIISSLLREAGVVQPT